MTDQTIYLARQPIVDANKELVGFELLFRATANNVADATDSVFATSTVIANAFTEIGLDQVIGSVDGYLNVDADFLYSEMIEALPASRIVLELLETTIVDERVIARVDELRQRKYRVAIDDFIGNFDDFDSLLPSVDLVKIDFEKLDELLVPMIVELLGKHKVTLLAEKVETPEQFRQAKDLGIKLFQGYHFARPEMLTAKRSKPAKLALLRLLALAMDDAETKDIEEEFKHHPSLTVNLLRLVNSAALVRRQVVTSLRHALVLLGRRQLRVWLQLLLYTSDRQNQSLNSPLLQLAATRGKLMEQLAARDGGTQSALKDLAFMTGILSLMDVVLEMPLTDILKELNVPVPVEAALLRREGALGSMLALTEQIEQADSAGIAASLQKMPGALREGELMPMQLAAYRWANEVAGAA
jgi:EAL and modified HD-GYP domain-containing signal transduction protein